MPYPLLLAGLAATAAGTGMQIAGSQQAKSNVFKTQNAFNQQQQELQRKANSIMAQSQADTSREASDTTLKQGANTRQNLAGALQQSVMPVIGVTNEGNNFAKTANQAGTATRQQATETDARNAAYGDWAAQQRLNADKAIQGMTPIQARGRINQQELQGKMIEAQHSGDELNGWGQLINGLGSVGMMAGAAGLGLGAGAGLSGSQVAAMSPAQAAALSDATDLSMGINTATGTAAWAPYTGSNLWFNLR